MAQAWRDTGQPAPVVIYRHSVMLRVLHWINALCLFILLLSGLQIFNAHPTLYWGMTSDPDHAVLKIFAAREGDGTPAGVTEIFGEPFVTTGVLGRSEGTDGRAENRAFPEWATIPGDRWLAMGRRWHFFFAWWLVLNGFLYVGHALFSRRFTRELLPTVSDWRSIGRSIVDHLKLRHPTGADAAHYNILQKLSYLAVMFVMLPAIVVFGLAMSPQMDTVLQWVLDLVGGRQSARTLHFVFAFLLVAFFLVHIFEVIVTGPINNLRSIVTGRFRLPPARPDAERPS